MDSIRRNRSISTEKVEEFLKKNKYHAKLTDFDAFWKKYQDSESKKAPAFVFNWSRQAVLASISLAVVFIAIFGASRLFQVKNAEILSWNRISGNGALIGVNNDSHFQTLNHSNTIVAGTRLKTDISSIADFTINKTMRLKIYPSSDMKIAELKQRSIFELASGKMAYSSGKLKNGNTVRVITPFLGIEVTGTRFSVKVQPDQSCRVAVSEGSVRISPLGYLMSDSGIRGILSENRIRQLTAQVLDKSGFKLSRSVDISAINEKEFYSKCLDLIKKNSTEINQGYTEQVSGKIAALFGELVILKAHFAETPANDRDEMKDFTLEPIAEKKIYRVTALKKLDLTGRESEILELPEGRQCYTVDQTFVILSSAGEIEKNTAVSGNKLTLTRPQLAGELVVMGSDEGGFYAWDLKGNPMWMKKDAGIQVFNAYPVSCGKLIAVPTADKGMRFYDRKGEKITTILDARNDGVYSSPISLWNGSTVLFGNEKGDFTAYDLDNRKILWNRNVIQDVPVHPLTGDVRAAIILSRKSGETMAIRPSDGTVMWSRIIEEAAKTRVNPSAEYNSVAICGNNDLFVLDILTGKTIAKKIFPSAIASMRWFRGNILIGDESGGLYLYNVRSGNTEELYRTNGPVRRISVQGGTVSFFSKDALVRLSADDLES